MASQTSADVLFDIKNSFYIGNYQHCINEAQKAKFSNLAHHIEKDVYMYRAYIAQGKFSLVANDIKPTSPSDHQSVQLLAVYCNSTDSQKEHVVETLEELLQTVEDKMFPLMASLIYYMDEDYDAVLRILNKSDDLERCALVIQTLLKINRIDLAMKELISMKEIDEDHTLTQLCQGWINLCKNGEKLQDAFYIFQELSDKYSPSPLLLNGQASALLAMGKYEEAEPLLQEALDKDPNCAETLINMIVLSQHLGKSAEVCTRYFNTIKDTCIDHPFVKEYKIKEYEFDRLAKMYAPA